MRKLVVYIVIGLFVVSMSACFKSTKPEKIQYDRVKCPNCGYEFKPADH